jgi:excisionase family DNA binding protein
MDQTNTPRTVSVPEAGRWLGIKRNAAYAAAHNGEIPTIKIGKLLRVPVAALERMLDPLEKPSSLSDQK